MIVVAWTGATLIFLLQLVVAVFLPVLTGIVTTKVTSPARKAVVLAVLSAVAAIVTAIVAGLVNGTPVDIVLLVLSAFANFVVAVATYFGFWSRPLASGESISSKIVANVGRTADPVTITTLPPASSLDV